MQISDSKIKVTIEVAFSDSVAHAIGIEVKGIEREKLPEFLREVATHIENSKAIEQGNN